MDTSIQFDAALLRRYDRSGPRYTSVAADWRHSAQRRTRGLRNEQADVAVAGVGWTIAFVPWVLRSMWIYLTPREDGKAG